MAATEIIKIAIDAGVDLNEVVFRVCISDIIEEIAFLYTSSLTPEKLKELIEIGKDGAKRIDPSTEINFALVQKGN